MKSKLIQAEGPAELKAEVDAIILADVPTFMHIAPAGKSYYLVVWN